MTKDGKGINVISEMTENKKIIIKKVIRKTFITKEFIKHFKDSKKGKNNCFLTKLSTS